MAGALSLAACGGSEEGGPELEVGEALPGGETTNDLLFGSNAFIREVTNASRDNRRLFATGNAFFNQSWVEGVASTTARDGLGPLFNARSCSACHFKDGRGRPPLEPDEPFGGLLLRLSLDAPEGPQPEPRYGGQIQPFSVDGVRAEGAPRVRYETVAGEYGDGTPFELLRPVYSVEEMALGPLGGDALLSPRVAPAMIGLGLLEAIEADALERAADPEDEDGDGLSGRLNRVPDKVRGGTSLGRFGWKAEQPSVRQQSAGAFLGDMGLTSSLETNPECTALQEDCLGEAMRGEQPEVADRILLAVERYSQLLAVPARRQAAEPEVLLGKGLFSELDCAGCHTPSHRTGASHPLAELRDQLIWPYTDLLLHDLGPELSDGRPSFEAEGSEWRTPPLWGLGFYPLVNGHDRLLHDGRARGVAEAILWHGGEAEASREGFRLLPESERAALVRFVESL